MKAQSGKSGKGGAGQKPQSKLVEVDKNKRKLALMSTALMKDKQRAQSAANRAKAKTRTAAAKKRGK